MNKRECRKQHVRLTCTPLSREDFSFLDLAGVSADLSGFATLQAKSENVIAPALCDDDRIRTAYNQRQRDSVTPSRQRKFAECDGVPPASDFRCDR